MIRNIDAYINVLQALGVNTQQKFEAWYNRFLKGHETMNLDMDGFGWDDAQIGFSYKFAEVTDTVTAMATIVDAYSPGIARGRDVPMRFIEGYIPRQKRYETLDEEDYRNAAEFVANIQNAATLKGESPYESIADYFSKNLLKFAADFPESHAQNITYQVGQMKSAFGLSLTDKNNPNGLVNIEFTANVQSDNTIDLKCYSIDSAGKVTYDVSKHPIQEINRLLNMLTFDGTYGKVEVEADEFSLLTLMRHPDFARAIGYLAVPGLFTASSSKADADVRATEAGDHVLLVDGSNAEVMKGYFKRLFPKVSEVKLHNNVVAVAKLDETTKKMTYPLLKAFNEHVMLFRPTGEMGTIKNVVPMRPDSSAFYSWMFGKRGIMDYWYTPRTKTQHYESELTALAVPNRPSKLFRIIFGESKAAQAGTADAPGAAQTAGDTSGTSGGTQADEDSF